MDNNVDPAAVGNGRAAVVAAGIDRAAVAAVVAVCKVFLDSAQDDIVELGLQEALRQKLRRLRFPEQDRFYEGKSGEIR
ncbi:MAG: hypothetical protein IJU53_12165 [Thermoguttaceae bacterium]|nr:hypothetical protein [Thermoguttaceae bacterium]